MLPGGLAHTQLTPDELARLSVVAPIFVLLVLVWIVAVCCRAFWR